MIGVEREIEVATLAAQLETVDGPGTSPTMELLDGQVDVAVRRGLVAERSGLSSGLCALGQLCPIGCLESQVEPRRHAEGAVAWLQASAAHG